MYYQALLFLFIFVRCTCIISIYYINVIKYTHQEFSMFNFRGTAWFACLLVFFPVGHLTLLTTVKHTQTPATGTVVVARSF